MTDIRELQFCHALLDTVPQLLAKLKLSASSFRIIPERFQLDNIHYLDIFTEIALADRLLFIVWQLDTPERLLSPAINIEIAKQIVFLNHCPNNKIVHISPQVEPEDFPAQILKALEKLILMKRNFRYYYSDQLSYYNFIPDFYTVKEARELLENK